MFKDFIIIYISSIILISTSMYIWYTLEHKKIIYHKLNIILKFIFCCFLITFNNLYMINFIRPAISSLIMMLYFISLYKDDIRKVIILPLYSQLIVLSAELIYISFILLVLHTNSDKLTGEIFGSLVTNISIATLAIVLSKFKLINKIYASILQITDKLKNYYLLFISIFIVILANILIGVVYYKVTLLALLIINTFVIVIYTIFVYFYLKANNNYVKVYDKYNTTLNSLKEYEDILSRYRVSNHENKNQLLTIRGMVKNKKVISYIDEIIENKLKDNEKLMFESLVIPEGGLRGLIYSKMLLMNEKGINFDLCVDSILKTTDLTCISDDLMLNICNIVGVYLDNAIEAVESLEEKYIIIEIYLDKTLNIAITNNYENDIDIDNIDNVGFSTKGNNHGYGLSLVKDILNNNKNITNYKQISDDEFTQEIRVKYKKM